MPTKPLGAAAILLVLAGLALRTWASGTLRKRRALTTNGPYGLCRHPLYLGSALVMIGFGLLIPDWVNVVVLFGTAAATYWLTILREERRLAVTYGAAWQAYAASTPGLLPLGRRTGAAGAWSYAQWRQSREYLAAVAAPAALAALELWRALS